MILVDTNVLLGFLHRDPKQRAVVRRQLAEIGSGRFILTPPVLHETMDFVRSAYLIDRLLVLLDELGVTWADPGEKVAWQDVVAWLRKYAEHEPDYVDAYLCVLSATDRRYRVWSNDNEFRTVWRRPNGSPVPMAVRG